MEELAEVTELLVSELVTNAVVVTRELDTALPMSVRLWLHGSRKGVVATVWDADPQSPVLQEQGLFKVGVTVGDRMGGPFLVAGWPETALPGWPVTVRETRVRRAGEHPRHAGRVRADVLDHGARPLLIIWVSMSG